MQSSRKNHDDDFGMHPPQHGGDQGPMPGVHHAGNQHYDEAFDAGRELTGSAHVSTPGGSARGGGMVGRMAHDQHDVAFDARNSLASEDTPPEHGGFSYNNNQGGFGQPPPPRADSRHDHYDAAQAANFQSGSSVPTPDHTGGSGMRAAPPRTESRNQPYDDEVQLSDEMSTPDSSPNRGAVPPKANPHYMQPHDAAIGVDDGDDSEISTPDSSPRGMMNQQYNPPPQQHHQQEGAYPGAGDRQAPHQGDGQQFTNDYARAPQAMEHGLSEVDSPPGNSEGRSISTFFIRLVNLKYEIVQS